MQPVLRKEILKILAHVQAALLDLRRTRRHGFGERVSRSHESDNMGIKNNRPNVLLIFTDQQRADTIAALGNEVIRTPSLDRLAQEGVAFTTYTPSPVCVPARCSMHYGQYPSRTGCYNNQYHWCNDTRKSFMAALTESGYRTHGIGKCHFVPDRFTGMHGFQTRERQEEGCPAPEDDEYQRFVHESGWASINIS